MEADEAYYESPDILGYIRLTVMEWVRGFNPRVRVFAPHCPTRKGRVLSKLTHLPDSKTILSDLKQVI